MQDGVEGIQGLLDTYRRDAAHVSDFAHLVEHLASVGRAIYRVAIPELHAWLGEQAHILKHQGPEEVLTALRDVPIGAAADHVATETRPGPPSASRSAPPTRPKLSCAHARLHAAMPPTIVNGKPTDHHPWKQSLQPTG
ncbi:MAG: hypothetical protein M1118_08715 [Chloroflexi bacterium]|nr:hypothetical protein [Chloroflexota bacterium]